MYVGLNDVIFFVIIVVVKKVVINLSLLFLWFLLMADFCHGLSLYVLWNFTFFSQCFSSKRKLS